MYDFPGTSYEVTGQNNEGVFSSLSRNFEQTIEEINSEDEKNTATTQSDSSNTEKASNTETEDEKSNTVDVPDTTTKSSSLKGINSTTTDGLGNKNQSSLNN